MPSIFLCLQDNRTAFKWHFSSPSLTDINHPGRPPLNLLSEKEKKKKKAQDFQELEWFTHATYLNLEILH